MSSGPDNAIGWCDRTWNPTRGCSIVSAGCHNCFAMKQAHRFRFKDKGQIKEGPYFGLTRLTESSGPQWTGKIRTVEAALLEPLSWRTPARIFVNSMSDLFHKDVPDYFIAQVFATMAWARHHTFQLLTKRAHRMQALLSSAAFRQEVAEFVEFFLLEDPEPHPFFRWDPNARRTDDARARQPDVEGEDWPLTNVWIGVSCEDQQRADERIPHLLQTPAAVRFVSAEPLLGPIDLGLSSATCVNCCRRVFSSRWTKVHRHITADFPMALLPENKDLVADPGIVRGRMNAHGALSVPTRDGQYIGVRPGEAETLPSLSWVIVGGESGPGARPMHVDWVTSLQRQCEVAGTAFFFKQWGAWKLGSAPPRKMGEIVLSTGEHHLTVEEFPHYSPADWHALNPQIMARVGKDAAGALLDGREWRQFPGEAGRA